MLARRGGSPFAPDLNAVLLSRHRAEGLALTSYHAADTISEPDMLDLVVREDASIALICGRGTDRHPGGHDRETPLVITVLYLGLVHGVIALAGALAQRYAQYTGDWHIAVRADRLQGAVAHLAGDLRLLHKPTAYTRDEYLRTAVASTADLLDAPDAVARRLVMPLLRGLGVASLFTPTNTGNAPAG